MKLIFIDEIKRDDKDKNFFAVGGLLMDSALYQSFANEVEDAFSELGWGSAEFKGRYVFSKAVYDEVPIEKRVAFVKRLAELSISKKNSKFKLFFAANREGCNKENYLKLLSSVTKSIPKPPNAKADKALLAAFVDETTLAETEEVAGALKTPLKKPIKLLEGPLFIESSSSTYGMMALDALLYLWSWTQVASADAKDLEGVFESLPPDHKKFKSSSDILSLVKSVKNITK